jgi:hypothetical protein
VDLIPIFGLLVYIKPIFRMNTYLGSDGIGLFTGTAISLFFRVCFDSLLQGNGSAKKKRGQPVRKASFSLKSKFDLVA